MKNEVNRTLVVKKKITLFFIILLSFLTLGAWNSVAWGKTWSWKVSVAVANGTGGKAKAEVFKSGAFGAGGSVEKSTGDVTSSSLVSTTATENHVWASSNYYHHYIFTATPYDGYSFGGWYTSSNVSGNASSGSNPLTGDNDNDGFDETRYAKFIPVTVNSVASNSNPTTNPLSITQPGAAGAKTATVVFNVSNADAVADFNYDISGDGWEFVSWSYDKNNKRVTITVRYTCTQTTSQGAHKGSVVLTSKAQNGTSQTATVAANVDLTPTLSANTNSIDFGTYTLAKDTKKNNPVTLTFNANAINFEKTADASIAPFSAVFSANHQTLTVYFEPTEVDSWQKDLVVTVKNNQNPQLSATQTIHLTGNAVRNDVTYTCNIADNYDVDANALNLATLWTSNNNEKAPAYNIVSFTPTGNNNEGATAPAINNNNMLSLGQAGTLVLSIHQPQTQSFNEKSDTKTITINKRVTAFSGSNYDKLVDAVWTADYSYTNTSTAQPSTSAEDDFYYTMDAPNFDNEALNNGTNLILFDPATKRITACNAGATKITFYQKETYKYTGATAIYKVAVSKRANDFKCSWNTWQKAMNPSETVSATFTTTRADYANFPIAIEQTFGENVATLTNTSATEKSITTTEITKGYAVWHLYQEEDYKFYAAEADVVVLVGMAEPPICYVFTDNTTHEFSTHINDWEGHFDTPIPMTAPVDRIWFTATRQFAGANYFVAQYSVDGGSNWRDICNPDLDTKDKDFGPYSFVGLKNNERVTHIRFGAKQGATLTKWYKNIKVSRKSYLNTVDAEHKNINKLDLPVATLGNSSQAKFYIDYSTCDDEITIESSDPHFTVNRTSVTANGDNRDTDKEEITVTYTSDAKGTHNGVITLTTSYQMRALSVSGTTTKRTQQLEWQDGFNTNPIKLPVGLVVNDQNIAVLASSGNRVIYSTDKPSIIRILNEGTEFEVIAAGTATLTAYEAGNDTWTDVTESRTVVATDKTIQEINWAQSFPRFMAIGDVIDLEAEVYLRNLSTGEKTYSAERTTALTYECPLNNGIISVSGNKMTILGYGEMTVTASVAGNEDYEAATPVTLPVIVRQPSAGCPTPYVLDYNNTVTLYRFDYSFTDWTTPELLSEQINLSKTKGKPDKLSYQYEGEEYKIASITAYGGYIKVQQLVEGAWSDVQGSRVEAVKNTWKVMDNLQLNENATAIRFVREAGGKGTHNFKDIHISLLQYLRANADAIELGDIKLGETRNFSVGFDYSDLKGDLTATAVRGTGLTIADNGAIDLSCGSHGHYDLSAALTPTVLGEWKDTIVIDDNVADLTLKVALHANIIEADNFVFEGNDGVWGTDANWNTGSAPGPTADVTINTDVNITGNVTVNSLTINEGATVTLTVTGSLTVGNGDSQDRITYGDMHVLNGGQVHLGNGIVKVRNFILDAALGNTTTASASGQVEDENERLDVMQDAYFQMSFDPSEKISYGWYDFVVPFEVEVLTGIYDANGAKLTNGVDYLVMEHSEANRAKGVTDWAYYRGTMQPGRVYTITLDETKTWNTFLFKKKAGATLSGSNSFDAVCSAGDADKRGWNGLGNGTLKHKQLSASGKKVQLYDHTNNVYVTREADNYIFAVGTAFFMQVDAAQTITFTDASNRPLMAPERGARAVDEFRLALIADETALATDHLWVSASEEATGEYTIGQDLLKMGTPAESKLAQMWVERDNMNLCDVELVMANDEANTPISISAPQGGYYTLAVEKAPEDAELYLTYNDQVIWNLSTGAYTLELAKGTTSGYGLRIEAAQAPQIATGMESTVTDTKSARKVLINNTLYIVTPEGKMYDVVGKSVK